MQNAAAQRCAASKNGDQKVKIGILTFHEADSYGAVLQAYALQQTLAKLGADSEFVQFNMPTAPAASTAPANASAASALFMRRIQAEGKKREALFSAFRQKYMHISAPYQPTDPVNADYDHFIAGSDQIWNFRIPGADGRYFLPFASPEKRHSYAASFGADSLPEKAKDWVAKQLASFSSISVREESGCQIVKELTNRCAQVCLDPTMLPDRADWEALTTKDENPYVLLFLLKYDEVLVQQAKKEAEKRDLPLRIISASFIPQVGMDAWNTTGVTQWLSAIRNAACVFTNSFHGMVFSMIFHRQFHIQRLTGELSSRNGRLDEMLSFLQLTDALDGVVCPDYEEVWKLLDERKAASIMYLRRIIENDPVA